MILYTTIAKPTQAEEVIEKSRFIAHLAPVDSREEAEAFIQHIRETYKDARHNVPAFVIGEKQQEQWASDDGEPQGTAGAPMVQLLVKEGLTNVVLVVTRYFGGIKLGTGGLVRAYTGVARKAVEEAGRFQVREMETWEVTIPYNLLDLFVWRLEEQGAQILDSAYGENVTLKVQVEEEASEPVIATMVALSKGSAEI